MSVMRHRTKAARDVPDDRDERFLDVAHLIKHPRAAVVALSAGAAAAGGALGEIADATEGFSGREIAKVRRERMNGTKRRKRQRAHNTAHNSASAHLQHQWKTPRLEKSTWPTTIHSSSGSPRKGRQGRVVQKGSSMKGRRLVAEASMIRDASREVPLGWGRRAAFFHTG